MCVCVLEAGCFFWERHGESSRVGLRLTPNYHLTAIPWWRSLGLLFPTDPHSICPLPAMPQRFSKYVGDSDLHGAAGLCRDSTWPPSVVELSKPR